MTLLPMAQGETNWFVAVATGLAALYTFLTPIIAKRQGQKAELSQDRRVDFDKMLTAMDREDERKSKEIVRLESALIAERRRSSDLEDELYKVSREKAELEGTIYRAGWRKNDKGGWQYRNGEAK
jgi:flagellar biosynthesis/type III secretory pathway M-ring protein FliF/YscJ